MILVRERFQLKFGKAKEAKELFKESKKLMQTLGYKPKVMTDLTGRSYTLVMETEFAGLAEFESTLKDAFKNDDWQKWYHKFVPLVESADREIFTVMD